MTRVLYSLIKPNTQENNLTILSQEFSQIVFPKLSNSLKSHKPTTLGSL